MRSFFVLVVLLVATLLPAAASAAAQDDAAVLELLMDQAQNRPSIAGPLDGRVPIRIGALHLEFAGVDVRDFFAHATFTAPYPAAEHPWDIGFSFRRTGVEQALRVIVDSEGTWFFKEGVQAIIATGQVENLATAAEETNHIDLVAVGNTGYFSVNDEYVATLDLSARDVSGDIAVGSAYFAEDQRKGESTPFEGFEIWSLDLASSASGNERDAAVLMELTTEATANASVAGPLSGELLLEENSINFSSANVSLGDFYAHAAFTNPYPATERPWDIGFGFHDTGGMDLRLAVSSDGEWFLSQGSDPFLASGQGAQVDTGAGGRNELDLVVRGATGYLAVNGEYVATLDLSMNHARGDVWVSSGFYEEDSIEGAMTGYDDFEVWSLDEAAPTSEEVEFVVQGDGEVMFNLAETDGSELSGLVSMFARGEQTDVQLGLFGTAGDARVGIFLGTCDGLEPNPAFDLNPVDDDASTSTSVTTIDAGFEELTDGSHALAIRSGADDTILACNEIPTP